MASTTRLHCAVMSILSVQHLRKTYGETVAVDQLSFQIERGEIFGLLGPNGAGKSTTIALCVGLLEPDSGVIEISPRSEAGANSPMNRAVRRDIGVAPQALALYEDLSAQDNLRFFGRVQGVPASALMERVDWALSFVGLLKVRKNLVSTFSGGMKRRLNLAVAVIHRPKLVLLDEPTVGVDPQSRNAILERVAELNASGTTVVYTSHYMEEAERLCDRIAVIDHGRLIGLGTVQELIAEHGGNGRLTVTHHEGEDVIFTQQPVEALNEIESRETVVTFRYEPPSLESVFLNLTGRALRD